MKNIVTFQEKIIPTKTIDDCTNCNWCSPYNYVEHDGCYYRCEITGNIVGDDGYQPFPQFNSERFEGFPTDIPDNCPLLNKNNMKKLYCKHCKKVTEHIPKLDAILNGYMVCGECSIMNHYCTLIKPEDKTFIKTSIGVIWVEWNENGTFKDKHQKPAVGLSLLMEPFNLGFTWETTVITEIIEETEDYLKFKTENSIYELYHTKPYDTNE